MSSRRESSDGASRSPWSGPAADRGGCQAAPLRVGETARFADGRGGPPPSAPKFFTRAQYALVDELTEILIPADEHSGGARAAGVVTYIDSGWPKRSSPSRSSDSLPDSPVSISWRAKRRAGLHVS